MLALNGRLMNPHSYVQRPLVSYRGVGEGTKGVEHRTFVTH